MGKFSPLTQGGNVATMEGKITGPHDIEAMLEGLTPDERAEVIAGAIADIDADLERRRQRNRELLERLPYTRSFEGEDLSEMIRFRNELCDRLGYPSGYGLD